jgi:hypothetical protein
MPTAINPQTGERIEWKDGQWVPIGGPDIAAAAEQAQADYAATLNPLQAGLVGAGRTLTNLGRGAANLFDIATGDTEGQEQRAQQSAAEESAYDLLRETSPAATTVGEIAPYLATAPLSGGALVQGAIGAGTGALEYGNQAEGAAVGGAVGAAAPALFRAGGRTANALRGRFGTQAVTGSDEAARLAGVLAEEAPLLPGQAKGGVGGYINREILDPLAETNPFTAPIVESVTDQQRGALTRGVAKALGSSADDLSDLGTIADDIGAGFEQVGRDIGAVPLPEDLQAEIVEGLGSRAQSALSNNPGFASGVPTGEELLRLRSNLAKRQSRLWGSDLDQAELIGDTVERIDDLIEAVADPGTSQNYARVREQYRLLKALEGTEAISQEGIINPRSAKSALRRKNAFGQTYTRKGPTTNPETAAALDLVRAASSQRVLPALANSGTPQRAGLLSLPLHAASAAAITPYLGRPVAPGLEGYARSALYSLAQQTDIDPRRSRNQR